MSFSQNWHAFTDSTATLSSPRSTDLNGDNIKDIVIGGGVDSTFCNNSIMAYDGYDGSLLWKRSSRDEVFGSAIFQDLTSDGIDDVFISGRSGQLMAINGLDGSLIWNYFPYNTNPSDSGIYNFYNPQFIGDIDGDSYNDILISNGGDHAAPSFQSNRPPGHLMIISSLTGNLIVKAVVPDSSETYCSPIVADIQNDGNQWILYGTGGENLGGCFYAVLLSDLLLGDISSSIVLDSDPNKGYIAPAAICQNTNNGIYDIIIQSYDGLVSKINGQNFSTIWTYQKSGTESSAEPVIGNFTGDLTPDVLLVLFNGVAPAYNDYFQVMLDGSDGSVQFIDSMGVINFASANAVDLNNDGRDEGIFSVVYFDNGYFNSKVQSVDFVNDTIITLDQVRTGVNIASTPLINDLDNDGMIDLIYCVKYDSLNPMGVKGINMFRHELSSIIPNAGIAWGSYLGNDFDGAYSTSLIPCGLGSIISGINRTFPSCNGLLDGSLSININGGSIPPYTYIWSNNSTDPIIQNLSSGTYWLHVTDSNGCFETTTISLPDPITFIFGELASPTCVTDSNGSATVVSSGCPCMFNLCTFLWDNGDTTKTSSSLTSGWNSVAITHANGCVVVDSVFIPIPNSGGMSSITVCDSYTWDSITYTSSGTYFNTYTDTSGCDSIHTLNLTILNSEIDTFSVSSCDSYVFNGAILDTSGIYSFVFTNQNLCDSIIVLDLTINQSSSITENVSFCESYVWLGTTYYNSGVYDSLLISSDGCDSLVTLNLNISFSDSLMYEISSCDSYTWDGQLIDSSGLYSNLYTNMSGCDSLVYIDLTIGQTVAEIIAPLAPNPSDLSVNIISGTAPFTFIWNTGETTPQITPNSNQNYWVIVTDSSGCISDTAYFTVDWVPSITNYLILQSLKIYPNPTKDIFNINFYSIGNKEIQITVYDIFGKKIINKKFDSYVGEFNKKVDLSNYSNGVYTLEMSTEKASLIKKILLQ
tara:strand:- start:5035 stop:7977 length:2943 start_codon:yes stop_codon:yes gene_type:complete